MRNGALFQKTVAKLRIVEGGDPVAALERLLHKARVDRSFGVNDVSYSNYLISRITDGPLRADLIRRRDAVLAEIASNVLGKWERKHPRNDSMAQPQNKK